MVADIRKLIEGEEHEILRGEPGRTTVIELSEVLGVPHTHVVKTMVLQNKYSHRLVACSFTGGSKVDKRQLVDLDEGGTKAWRFIPNADLVEVAGFPEGAVPPIGLDPSVESIFVDPRVLRKGYVVFPLGDGLHYVRGSPQLLFLDGRVKERVISMG